jgi:hypothetical protein
MNKTRGLLLTAGFVLATAFTFSCSGDDGGGGGGDPSSSSGGGEPSGGSGVNFAALSKQVYLLGERSGSGYVKTGNSTDNSDVVLRISSNLIQIGTIQGGVLSLNSLPSESEVSELLGEFWGSCDGFPTDEFSACESNLSIPPNLSAFGNDVSFRLTASGKENCYLKLYMVKSDDWSSARSVDWGYFSVAGSITGTLTYTRISEDNETTRLEFDMSFSKGWNLYYGYESNGVGKVSSALPANNTLEWGLRCN